MFGQGIQGLAGLQKKFQFIDVDGSGCLSYDEFKVRVKYLMNWLT